MEQDTGKLISVFYDKYFKKGVIYGSKKSIRIYTSILTLQIITIVVSSYYYDDKQAVLKALPIFACAFILLVFIFIFPELIIGEDDINIKKIQDERTEITQKIENKNQLDIFNTIQLSLNQLNEYYAINKSQAKRSFYISMMSIIIGFITIISGVWFYYYNNNSVQMPTVSVSAGIISEFIGAAHFFMYKKSIEQANFFFGQLIKIQDTMLAINLTKDVEDKAKANELTDKIITSLLERSLK